MKEMTGTKYGRWSVLERFGTRRCDGQVLWKCQCECGNIKPVLGSSLRNGHSKSCGCLNNELRKARFKKPRNKLEEGKATLNTVVSSYKIRCVRKDIVFDLTNEEAYQLLLGNCVYCGQIPNLIKSHPMIRL